LNAVLAHPDGAAADATICLGDVVGYGGEPRECIAQVRRTCSLVLQGNHDSGAAGLTSLDWFNPAGSAAISWITSILSQGESAWLAGLPLRAEMERLVLCHSYPPDPGIWRYVLSSRHAVSCCRAFPGRRMVIGHTHLPAVWDCTGDFTDSSSGTLPPACVVNAGSVGQPRDGDPRAAFLLIDTSSWSFRHVRVDYEIDAAAEAIRAAGLPDSLWRRLYEGR
jgi:diadenosine tetraphosphatase ApaH/serine/threonine PP2A family protein phosphatase